MLRKFIGDKYFCGLDIGAETIKASLIKAGESPSSFELVGIFESRTNGYRDASVTDLGELSECIHAAINGISHKTGIKIKEVQLGIGGELIKKNISTAIIPLVDRGNKVISQQDTKKIQTQARLLGVEMDEVIIHDFPQQYKVDDVNTALNPVGLYGRKLEIQTLLMVVNNTLIKNLTKAVNQAGYDVLNLVYTSYATEQSSLEEYQKKQGCVLIDIGSSTTNILIFKDEILKNFIILPMGGEEVTKTIAKQLNISFDLAEDIKKSYAFAMSSEVKEDEEILIKKDDGYVPVKKEMIIRAIAPVLGTQVDAILGAIEESGIHDQLNIGIILTGGGSLLPGFPELIEEKTNLPVRLGKVYAAEKRMNNAAKYTAAVGLAQFGLNSSLGYSSSNGHAKWTKKVTNKVKELYQEYF